MNKLLIVDDNRDLCKVISDILSDKGFEVTSVYDGESGVSRIKEGNFDLMILDYKLPGINGIEVLRQARIIQPSIITIMMSGYRFETVGEKALDAGVYTFLDNPFSIIKLVEIVREALGID